MPNPSFEEFYQQTSGHAHLNNLKFWQNPSGGFNDLNNGTPDHLLLNEALKAYQINFSPFEGKSVVGIITYLQRVPNYREYIAIKLSASLQKDSTYTVSFYASSGYKKAFGNIGSNGLGIRFSLKPLSQKAFYPIASQPHFHQKKIFYKYGWEQINYTFKADSAYEYLTIGNFFDDTHTQVRYYSFDVDPQAYTYIDSVSVRLKPIEIPIEEQPLDLTQLPEKVEGRLTKNQGKIPVNNKTIELKVWDNQDVDGDIISLKFNGEWLVRNHKLRRRRLKLNLNLEEGKNNFLILYAENLGKSPPNTATFSVKSGGKIIKQNISSDLNSCGAVQFFYEE